MKIAIVNRHPDDVLGGSELQCDIIASGLAARGHNVTFIAPAGRVGRDYKRVYNIIPVESDAVKIGQAIVDAAPDVVYWRFNKYHFYRAVRTASSKNIPVIFALSHISDAQLWSARENPFAGLKQFLKFIKQGCENLYNHLGFLHVDGVTSNNAAFLGRLRHKEQRYIPNAMNCGTVPFTWPRPFVLWVANIKPHKQPEKYLDLARALPDAGVDFLMVGQIQDVAYDWLKDAHKDLSNFHYLGPKTPEEVNGMLEQALMLAHTCKPEGFPNNVIQAWQKGRPVVSLAFDPGGYIDKEGLGGYADNDWTRFVEQVRVFIERPDLQAQTGARAQDFAARTFSADRMAEQIETFAQELVSARKNA